MGELLRQWRYHRWMLSTSSPARRSDSPALWRRVIALIAALAVSAPSVAQTNNLPNLGETSQGALSPQNERRIADMIMREVRRHPQYVDDPESAYFIETIGRRLVAVSDEPGAEFEFILIRDNTINAFAMPGGVVGVHTGLITAAQTEAELAGVLAHEVSHVTQRHIARQMDRQNQLTWPMLAAMALGLLAARSNPQITQAAIVGSQAAAIQASLNYSRDFEREADRVGFQLLEQSGFDVNGMPAFFERLGRATQFQEANAPAYLRTHPLNTERMADLQNRAASVRYRQTPDSLEFHLVRAKLRGQLGGARDIAATLEAQLKDKRFVSEGPLHYGLAVAWARAREWKRATDHLSEATRLSGRHGMFETLAASIQVNQGQGVVARDRLAQAIRDFGPLTYLKVAYSETLQGLGQHAEALAALEDLSKSRPRDSRLHSMLAKSYAGVGNRALQHRQQAEYYYLLGSIPAAIEQLQLARSSRDADFYLQSSVDARIRALRVQADEEKKNPVKF